MWYNQLRFIILILANGHKKVDLLCSSSMKVVVYFSIVDSTSSTSTCPPRAIHLSTTRRTRSRCWSSAARAITRGRTPRRWSPDSFWIALKPYSTAAQSEWDGSKWAVSKEQSSIQRQQGPREWVSEAASSRGSQPAVEGESQRKWKRSKSEL